MGIEILVFSRDKGVLHIVRDFLDGGEQTTFGGELVHQTTFARVDLADRFGGVVHQFVVVRQVTAVKPKDCAHDQGGHRHTNGDERKNRPKKGEDEPEHA